MTLTQLFTNIANAIRSKKGTSGTIVAENFPQEISSIVTPNLQSKSVNITQNGTTTVTPDSGYNGLDEVTVATNVEPDIEYDFSTSVVNSTSVLASAVKRINNINTTGRTRFDYLCYTACNLEYIAVLDTSSATSFNKMFTQVGGHLTDEAIDNILQMCINATSYTGTKTLGIGGLYLTASRIPNYDTRIPNLPHYQEFIDAGWSIS
jgi:hypothetical protein